MDLFTISATIFLLIAVFLAAPAFIFGVILGGWLALVSLLPNQMSLVLVCGIALIYLMWHWPRSVRNWQVVQEMLGRYTPAFAFICLVFISELIRKPQASLIMSLVGMLSVSFLVALVASDPRSQKLIIKGFISGVTVLSIGELWRVLNGGTLHAFEVAFGINPNYLAHYTGIAALLSIWFVRNLKSSMGWRVFFILNLLGTLVTLSRGPILALIVGLGVWVWVITRKLENTALRNYIRVVIISSIPLLSRILDTANEAFRGTSNDTANVESRLERWSSVISYIQEAPIIGVGSDRVLLSSRDITTLDFPHNVFLEVWAAYGIFILGLFIIGFYRILKITGPFGLSIGLFLVISFSVSGTLVSMLVAWTVIGLLAPLGLKSNRSVGKQDKNPSLRKDRARA